MKEEMKRFIATRPEFNRRALARAVNWSPSSFHLWMTNQRPIPTEKATALADVLKKYGFIFKPSGNVDY
jgi:hypothetical protein